MTDSGQTRRPGGQQVIPRPAHSIREYEAPWMLGSSWNVDELVAPVPIESAPMLPTFPDAQHSAVLLLLADGPNGSSDQPIRGRCSAPRCSVMKEWPASQLLSIESTVVHPICAHRRSETGRSQGQLSA